MNVILRNCLPAVSFLYGLSPLGNDLHSSFLILDFSMDNIEEGNIILVAQALICQSKL